ncbi:MAG TPA: UvrD-helicase domain-containing protein [Candidatus Egerieousia sp.]|nr:UvrD-helicase domain-containing protein [Candidatus Egerieousia sp.]HPT05635.1 UvrD-helicase domain-containing protein [Candidatus Egerieousia sp.]
MESEGNSIFEGLNESQKEAVNDIEGPSLIIAGAGSGKTKVLTCKVANILAQGYPPACVLALTFTNKAAKEMKERIGELVGRRAAYRVWMGTFHSIFLRFLRQYAELLGFPPGFTIYDKDDSKSLVKRCIKELELDDSSYKPAEISSRISKAKNDFITPDSYVSNVQLMEADRRAHKARICEVYRLYQKRCVEQGAMDFDDILLNTYRLLSNFPEAFGQIKAMFKFILVDEYQDTNFIQYQILKGLAQDHHNITVVGDDAQSIYAFRGARIENILNFKKDYPESKIYRLERNYRSSQTIVNAANSLISKNKYQITKKCFSQKDMGEKIELIPAFTEQEEALLVASSIAGQMYKSKEKYESFAVLYRTNAQSRAIEEALRKKNMPYKIYAGHSFYERTEIKNMIAYLRLIENPLDDEAFKRVINFPARAIGTTTVEKLVGAAVLKHTSICNVVKELTPEEINIRPAVLGKIRDFVAGVEKLREGLLSLDAYEIAMQMNTMFNITSEMRKDLSLDGQSRLENVEEFFNSIKEFVDEGAVEYKELASGGDGEGGEAEYAPVITLDLYLQNIALISDSDSAVASSGQIKPVDNQEQQNNKISLMTVHAAKGLEFPYVYVVGMEENLFPSGGLYGASEKDIEEERRLFYVAITRAKEGVKLSYARSRMKYGEYVNNLPSRFLKEIDKQYLKNPIEGGGLQSFASSHYGQSSRSQSDGVKQPGTEQNKESKNNAERSYSRSFTSAAEMRPKNPNFIPDSPLKMEVGQRVEHERFGFGTIISLTGESIDKKAIVDFNQGGRKTLLLKFAKMKIV